jgi:hypothetical protein
MSEAKAVTASFIPAALAGTSTLTVQNDGTGAGTITGDGINCGTDCFEAYAKNPTITLSAAPGANSKFIGWFGACSGIGTCSVPMVGEVNVIASFESTLVVAGSGSGSGSGKNENCPPIPSNIIRGLDLSSIFDTPIKKTIEGVNPGTIKAYKLVVPNTTQGYVGDVYSIKTTAGATAGFSISSCKGVYQSYGSPPSGCFTTPVVEVTSLQFVVNIPETIANPKRYCHLIPGNTYWLHAYPGGKGPSVPAHFYFEGKTTPWSGNGS